MKYLGLSFMIKDKYVVNKITSNWLKKLPNISKVLTDTAMLDNTEEIDFVTKNSKGNIVHAVFCLNSTSEDIIKRKIKTIENYQNQINRTSKDIEIILISPYDNESIFENIEIPNYIRIFLIRSKNNIFEKTKNKLFDENKDYQIPGTFYVRDILFKHHVTIFNMIDELSKRNNKRLSKDEILKEIRNQSTANKNFLITYRTLGFINDNYRFTSEGLRLMGFLKNSKASFYKELTKIYYPFFINIINALVMIAIKNDYSLSNIKCTYKEISNMIKDIWGTDIRFLKDGQTISTLMRNLEELMCIQKIGKGGAYKLNGIIHPEFLPWTFS